MVNFEYNPIADFVTLRIKCPKCGKDFLTEELGVPSPDWSAETHHDSIQDEEFEQQCSHCCECFNITLYTGFYGGEGEIDVGDSDVGMDSSNILEVIEDFPEDEGYNYDKELFDASHSEIATVLEAIEPLSDDVKEKLHYMLYAKIITNIETYLGDTLKSIVLNDEKYLRKFVQEYSPYKKEEFKMCDIFDKYDRIKDIVKQSLDKILYHDLGKIKQIYIKILDVDMGDISILSKAVVIRHDIVHRNGKDKEGNVQIITKKMVSELAHTANDFIYNIDIQLPSANTAAADVVFGGTNIDKLF